MKKKISGYLLERVYPRLGTGVCGIYRISEKKLLCLTTTTRLPHVRTLVKSLPYQSLVSLEQSPI
jgi:hypothetical protein